MKNILDRYLSIQTDDELVIQRSRLLIVLILIMSTADLLTLFTDIVFGTVRPVYLAAELLAFAIFGVLYWYTRRGHRWPPFVCLAFVILLMPSAIFDWNPESPLVLAMAVPVAIVPLIASPWLCIPVAAMEAVLLYVISFTFDYPSPNPTVVITLGVLGVVSWLSSSTLENAFKESRRHARDLAESNRELQASRALLEDYARELEHHSAYLEASAEVSRAATLILETDQLIRQVVELIREQFGLYYVGLFLVDETGEWAVLRAGTDEAGRAMLARGHRMRIGEGMIGWSIANAQARVALEASADAVRLTMPELPDTRSEAALPLRSRGQILGALTIQSNQPGTFDGDAIAVLQTMTDQVAVALDNARLFAESQAALEAMRRAYGELSREAWAELLRARPDLAYRSDERGVTSAKSIWRPEMERALQEGQTIQGKGLSPLKDNRPDVAAHQPSAISHQPSAKLSLAVPIKVRGNVIGVLDTYKPGDAGEWTHEEITLLEALTDQLGMALESARLFQDTQRHATRERLTREITDKMRRAIGVEDIIQTAVDELSRVLGTSRTFVRLGVASPLRAEPQDEASQDGEAKS